MLAAKRGMPGRRPRASRQRVRMRSAGGGHREWKRGSGRRIGAGAPPGQGSFRHRRRAGLLGGLVCDMVHERLRHAAGGERLRSATGAGRRMSSTCRVNASAPWRLRRDRPGAGMRGMPGAHGAVRSERLRFVLQPGYGSVEWTLSTIALRCRQAPSMSARIPAGPLPNFTDPPVVGMRRSPKSRVTARCTILASPDGQWPPSPVANRSVPNG